jgi:hypothetical protein
MRGFIEMRMGSAYRSLRKVLKIVSSTKARAYVRNANPAISWKRTSAKLQKKF